MLNKFLGAVCVAMALSLTGCMSDSSTESTDGTASGLTDDLDSDVSIGSDGAMVVGVNDPNGWNGPAELAGSNTIYFGYDSDQIQDQYISVMQEHAKYLRGNPDARIVIEGHTDERGTPEYNIALGERRARSVAAYMKNLGVDINQLSIVSYGEEKPLDPNHDESAWSKNRRAVLNY